MTPHSSTLAWKSHGRRSLVGCMGSLRVGHDGATSLSLFTFMHWRRKWQPTPVFLPGESQERESLLGCHLQGCTESDMTEAPQHEQITMSMGQDYSRALQFPMNPNKKGEKCILWKSIQMYKQIFLIKYIGFQYTRLCVICQMFKGQFHLKTIQENLSIYEIDLVQFSSVTQMCPTLCDPMNRSMPGLPIHHQLLEFTQIHVH